MKYALAGHIISIQVSETAKTVNSVCSDATQFLDTILPSFIPFKTDDETAMASQPLMNLTIVDTLKEIKDARLIRDVDTGNGMTRVDKLPTGGYQFLVRDIFGYACALLQTSSHFHVTPYNPKLHCIHLRWLQVLCLLHQFFHHIFRLNIDAFICIFKCLS